MCFSKKKKAQEVKPAPKAEKEVKPAAPAKKEAAPAPAPEPEIKSPTTQGRRSYHVVKREDGKWEVKFAGGKKAIKLFDTQAEAVEYTKTMAANQDGAMLVHNSKGKNKGRIKAK